MDIRNYLDSTYLKTAVQAGISEEENRLIVSALVKEAVRESFKLVMIRPEYISLAREIIDKSLSEVLVGTVIDFPDGDSGLNAKLSCATEAVKRGADELDFVCDYKAFISGEIEKVREEIECCTRFCLEHRKKVKWIIEVAALEDQEIIRICTLIKNTIISRFKEDDYNSVFVKSSTGVYETRSGYPNGATLSSLILMLENASPLPVKAAGGIRTYEEAIEMLRLGVKRIGTSSAKAIVDKEVSEKDY